MLLVVAQGIHQITTSPSPVVPLVVTALVAGGSAAEIGSLIAGVRSNARETAAAVAARVRPTDLLVIAPEWLASSFNFYFEPRIAQIDFPHQGREGAIAWDDLAARTGSVPAFQETKRRLLEARRAGRRVWLLTDLDELQRARESRLPVEDEELATVPRDDWRIVARVRLTQILAHLGTLYGWPRRDAVPVPRDLHGTERLIALLFEPAGRDSVPSR
jgi:hypothetical protein